MRVWGCGVEGSGIRHEDLRYGDQRCEDKDEVEDVGREIKQVKNGQEGNRVEDLGRRHEEASLDDPFLWVEGCQRIQAQPVHHQPYPMLLLQNKQLLLVTVEGCGIQ